MKIFIYLSLLLHLTYYSEAQKYYNISFIHDGKTIYGTFTTPNGIGKFPVIIINPGSGAIDRDGTIPMVGANVSCLYPALLNDTLKPYKELSDALVDSGYAVLRYDKLEYTYHTNLGTITFHKVWLPVESAIDYVKTRNDVDTNRIILIGHSEGSSLIPFIAKSRSDIKALISIAGPRTPFDTLLAYQIVNIAQTCGGNIVLAQTQANQILSYFKIIRTSTWSGSTPPLVGVPASVWHDYILATDSVAINYNEDSLPTIFIGMALDVNVPGTELIRFQNEVTITNDFLSITSLIHYMTSNNNPHVSSALTDTIIHWLRQNNFSTQTN
jgi:dienelactone hydrolase